jgi:hypothetical protein
LSFKTCCYGINLFQVVIITTMLLATFYVDVYFFVISTFALFLIDACTIVLYGHSQDQWFWLQKLQGNLDYTLTCLVVTKSPQL